MKNLKWWHWGLIGVVGLAALSIVVDSPEPAAPQEHEVGQVDVNAEFTLIAGESIFTMTFSSDADPGEVERTAREHCNEFEFCQIHGWSDPEIAARNFPMTDREIAERDFAYSLNRSSGLDRALWNCARWQTHQGDCLAS